MRPWASFPAITGGVAALALGQLLALLVTTTGVTSSLLARKGINAPTAQSLLNYLLLALIYGSVLLVRRKPLGAPWYFYCLFAVVDVEANYAVVLAYQYTSMTSVALLDCWAIPSAMGLTWLALRTRYGPIHSVGVAVCVAGLGLVVLSDAHAGDREAGSSVVLGDLLVLLGSTMYAASNVFEEFLARKVDRVELLALIGAFGFAVSVCQLLLLERRELRSVDWDLGTIALFVGFAAALFGFYSLVPLMLQMSGSTMLNLSLLMSDIWAVAFRALVFHQAVDWLYYAAFAAVAAGLITYSSGGEALPALAHMEMAVGGAPGKGAGEMGGIAEESDELLGHGGEPVVEPKHMPAGP